MKRFLSSVLAIIVLFSSVSLVSCISKSDMIDESDSDASFGKELGADTQDTTEKPTEKATKKPASSNNSGNSNNNNNKKDKNPANKNTRISIFATAPLTGPAGVYGNAVCIGVLKAVNEINAAGGVGGMALCANIYDDAAESSHISGLYDLAFDNGMQLSLGSATSDCCQEFIKKAEEDGVFVLTPSAPARNLSNGKNVFRMCLQDWDEGAVAAKFINENHPQSRVGVVCESRAYFYNIRESFIDNCQTAYFSLDESMLKSDPDRMQALRQICDTVLVIGEDEKSAEIMRSICEEEHNVNTFYVLGGSTKCDSEIGGVEVKLLAPANIYAESGAAGEFFADPQFESRGIEDDAMIFAAYAYDSVYAICEALKIAINNGADVKANMSAKEMSAIVAEVFASDDFSFYGLTGGGANGEKGLITWNDDGTPNTNFVPVKLNNNSEEK